MMLISANISRPWAAVATLGLLLTPTLNAQTQVITELLPLDPGGDKFFGLAVALDGDYAAVTAPNDVDPTIAGAVEIYREDGVNGWVHDARITNPPFLTSQTDSEGFGSYLALDGDTLVVSNNYVGNVPESRDVDVFRRDDLSGTWALEQTLTYPGSGAFPLFGPTTDIQGDVIVVGSAFGNFGTPANVNAEGAIYVYERVGTTWSLSDTLSLTPVTLNARVGHEVKIVGDRVVASVRPTNGQGPRGAVVYARSAAGDWIQEALLETSSSLVGYYQSLDYDGHTLAFEVAPFATSALPAPLIVSFRRAGSTWTRLPDLQTTPAPQVILPSPLFVVVPPLNVPGRLAVRGDRIYFGSGASFVGDLSGTVEAFEFDGSGWQLQGSLQSPGLREGDLLGRAIAQDEGRLLVGAIGKEDPASGDLTLNIGAAYLFRGGDAPLTSYCQATPFACTTCPCGNDAAAGTATGCANSSGVGAELVGSGEPLPLDDSLRFDLEGATPSSFAFLAVGTTPLPNLGSVCPPGSGVVGSLLDGKRCIGGGLRRLGLRAVDAQGSVGATNTPWGGGNAPAGGLVAASGGTFGATLYYQAFYRDNGAGSCGTGVNTSNGVKATLLP